MAARKTRKPAAVLKTLPAAMTGRASPAKAALGDEPVFAYFKTLPQLQRGASPSVSTRSRPERCLPSSAA